jgi:hypothetical protein
MNWVAFVSRDLAIAPSLLLDNNSNKPDMPETEINLLYSMGSSLFLGTQNTEKPSIFIF